MRIKLSVLQKIISEALENAYDVLGVQPGATPREIKAAWARLVHDARSSRGGGRGGHEGALINYYGKAVRAALANVADPEVPPMFEPRIPKAPPAPREPKMSPDMGVPGEESTPFDEPGDARRQRKAKADYKVYTTKDGRSVVRVQGKLYGTGPDGALGDGDQTIFGKNDRVGVDLSPDLDGRMRVSDRGHDQVWSPMDEVRQIIDDLVIESIVRVLPPAPQG